MNCERCAKPEATARCITIIFDCGLGNGTVREEVTYDLCIRCFGLARQPVIEEQFFDYEPYDETPESHDYAYADYEREIVHHGEWY
jgi:hypothetical protein